MLVDFIWSKWLTWPLIFKIANEPPNLTTNSSLIADEQFEKKKKEGKKYKKAKKEKYKKYKKEEFEKGKKKKMEEHKKK